MSIEITEVKNARSMNAENTQFDVEINHPEYGWIPYMLTPWDTDMTIDNAALLSLIGSDFVPFSQADEDARQAEQKRYQRDSKLTNEVDPVVSNPLRWADLSSEEQTEVAAYRTALLDVPQQPGFPSTVSWPTPPACL
jgi:hypothetical protein